MKKDYFALLFSDQSVFAAQAGRGGSLRFFAKKDLPAGVIERGEIKNPEALKAVVVNLVKTAKIKNRFVVVGLPEIKSFTRTLKLPPLPVREITDAVRWESEPLLPFSLSEAYLDWMILDQSAVESRVLVVALPKNLVDGFATLLEEIDLQPLAFEITSLSLARLVPRLKSAQIIIDIGSQEAVLAVVGPGGGIEVSSTVNYENTATFFSEILSAVKSAITFYRKKITAVGVNESLSREREISQIFLTGQSLSPEISQGLKKETGLPVGTLKNLKSELAVITSLAGKEVASPGDEKTINLIPPRIQGIYDQESKIREFSRWIKIFLLVFLVVNLAGAGLLVQITREINKVTQKTLEFQTVASAEFRDLESQTDFLNNRAQKVISLHESLSPKLTLLDFLLKQNSTEINLRQIVFDGESQSFFVSGLAADRKSLVHFRENLEKNELVKQVKIPLSSLEKEENADFTVTIVAR